MGILAERRRDEGRGREMRLVGVSELAVDLGRPSLQKFPRWRRKAASTVNGKNTPRTQVEARNTKPKNPG
jgi:hypothetical protein